MVMTNQLRVHFFFPLVLAVSLESRCDPPSFSSMISARKWSWTSSTSSEHTIHDTRRGEGAFAVRRSCGAVGLFLGAIAPRALNAPWNQTPILVNRASQTALERERPLITPMVIVECTPGENACQSATRFIGASRTRAEIVGAFLSQSIYSDAGEGDGCAADRHDRGTPVTD